MNTQFTGEDILNDYATCKEKTLVFSDVVKAHWIDLVGDHIVKRGEVLTDMEGKNLRSFMYDLDCSARCVLWAKLTSEGKGDLKLIKSVHRWCAEAVVTGFGVPMGEAGVGVVPQFPKGWAGK